MTLYCRVQSAAARQYWFALCLLATCLFSFTPPVTAAKRSAEPDSSMQFAVVRGSSASCEPVCPEWIWAEGDITSNTPARLKKFLKSLGGRKLPIVIQSPGGDVEAAFAMGRMIRAKGLDVAVGYTTFSSCTPRQKGCDALAKGGYTGVAAAGFAYCNSACPLVLAGGAQRLVGTWAQLGVHQITTTTTKQKVLVRTTTRIVKGKKVVTKKVVSRKDAGTFTSTKMRPALRRSFETYLTEMGVSTSLLKPIIETPAAGILRLEQVELLKMKLITSLDQVEVLTSPAICKAQPLPANCREDPARRGKAPATVAAKLAAPEPADTKPAAAVVGTLRSAPKQVGAGHEGAPDAQRKDEPEGGLAGFDQPGPMRFAVVRGSDPACDPDCPEWISAEGTITGNSAYKLRLLLDQLGDRQLPIVISSSGGDVRAAMEAGRLIRERQLDVAVARTRFVDCLPSEVRCAPDDGVYVGSVVDTDATCASACPVLLAGGVRRLVGTRARLMIHAVGFEQQLAIYLYKMQIKPRFMIVMQRVTSIEALQLLPLEMASMRLTTGPQAVDLLTGPASCKVTPRPQNCRVVVAGQ